MVIKSITYKYRPGLYRKLITYIMSDKNRSEESTAWSYFHNLSEFETEKVIRAFEANQRYAKKHSRTIAARHLIISFSPENTKDLNPDIIRDLVNKYIELWGLNGVMFGRLHQNPEDAHIHVHLVVSGNEYQSNKSTRISKAKFLELQRELERYQAQNYPELEASLVKIGKSRKNAKTKPLTEGERKMTERLGNIPTKKAEMKEQLLGFIQQAQSTKALYDQLLANGYEIYLYKEKVRGIIKVADGKKFRFSTLGLTPEMILELQTEREKRLAVLEEGRRPTNNKTRTFER